MLSWQILIMDTITLVMSRKKSFGQLFLYFWEQLLCTFSPYVCSNNYGSVGKQHSSRSSKALTLAHVSQAETFSSYQWTSGKTSIHSIKLRSIISVKSHKFHSDLLLIQQTNRLSITLQEIIWSSVGLIAYLLKKIQNYLLLINQGEVSIFSNDTNGTPFSGIQTTAKTVITICNFSEVNTDLIHKRDKAAQFNSPTPLNPTTSITVLAQKEQSSSCTQIIFPLNNKAIVTNQIFSKYENILSFTSSYMHLM